MRDGSILEGFVRLLTCDAFARVVSSSVEMLLDLVHALLSFFSVYLRNSHTPAIQAQLAKLRAALIPSLATCELEKANKIPMAPSFQHSS
jgi:hypothetical protein